MNDQTTQTPNKIQGYSEFDLKKWFKTPRKTKMMHDLMCHVLGFNTIISIIPKNGKLDLTNNIKYGQGMYIIMLPKYKIIIQFPKTIHL